MLGGARQANNKLRQVDVERISDKHVGPPNKKINGLSIPDYEQASLCRPGVRYHLAQAFGLRATLNRCQIVRDECQKYRGQPAAFSSMHLFPAYSRNQYVSDPHMKESVCF